MIETFMSHLACADEDVAANEEQRRAFAALAGGVKAKRLSLANSAGICLGPDYAFGLTRPGLALYGGVPRREAEGHISQVARVEAQVVQRRRIEAGARVGYGGTFTAAQACELAILNIGYADGYLRGFSNSGRARIGDVFAPVVGRVSMDLTAIRVDEAPAVGEGDWIELDYDLPGAAAQSGLSQYEVLTTLGSRFERVWIEGLAQHLIRSEAMLAPRPAFGAAIQRFVIGTVLAHEGVEILLAPPDVEGEIGTVVGAKQFGAAKPLGAGEELSPGAGRAIGRLERGPRFLSHLVTPDQSDHAQAPVAVGE
jgi:hypothetical protein